MLKVTADGMAIQGQSLFIGLVVKGPSDSWTRFARLEVPLTHEMYEVLLEASYRAVDAPQTPEDMETLF